MPEVTAHAPGNFCWVELATTDDAAAKRFYTELFGWTTNEIPMGEEGGMMYIMLQKDGKDVGALYKMMPDQQMPPNWQTYVATDDIDNVAEKAKSLGGNVVAGPFDVYDSGRMAVVADPAGAMFGLWQAKEHIGYRVKDESGSVCWSELTAPDLDAARKFYGGLFGWTWKESPEYTEWQHGGQSIGGAMQPKHEGMPPHWMPYFAVDDADTIVAKAKSLGASVYVEPTDIPNVGRFAVVADPQGAAFAIIKLAY
ncbi:MAG TPA: VOC family protein [Thermoanaerobaculia bacterium]